MAGVTTEVDTSDPPMGECLPWEENKCGDGRKCMPYSVEDDRLPDFFQCCDELGTALPGEACDIMEYDGSCLDSCVEGSMCVLDNPDDLRGQCREFCDPASNSCGNDQTCKSFFELLPGVVTTPLCMDKCDPLTQDCSQEGWYCIPDTPTESGQSGFLCSPPPPTPPKTALEGCFLANDCEAGLVCIPQDRVPGCTALQCCTAYCSLEDGDSTCQEIDPDLSCVDWMSPDPTWTDVGACALPT